MLSEFRALIWMPLALIAIPFLYLPDSCCGVYKEGLCNFLDWVYGDEH